MCQEQVCQSRLLTYELGSLEPDALLQNFRKYGGVLLTGAIDVKLVKQGQQDLRERFADRETLVQMGYDRRHRLGYTPPGREGFQSDPAKKNFHREALDLNPKHQSLEFSVARLFARAEYVAQSIIDLLEKCTTLRADMVRPGTHILRAARYLTPGMTPREILFDAHRDFGLLTVFIGSGQAGLQAEVKGSFDDIVLDPGDVLVGVGTQLAQFLHGYDVRALKHRVVGGEEERLSSFFFYELDPDVMLPRTNERSGDMVDRVMELVAGNG